MSLLFLIQVHMFWKVSISMFLFEMKLEIICPHISQAPFDGTPFNSVGAWVALFVEFPGTPIFREMRTFTVLNLEVIHSHFVRADNQFCGAHTPTTKATDVRSIQPLPLNMATDMCSHIRQWEDFVTGEAPLGDNPSCS